MIKLRAYLLAFLALAVLAAPATGAPYVRMQILRGIGAAPTPPAIPTLGPGAAWTGTLNTVAVPTDPARGAWPSAKPTLHWMDPSDMPLVTDQYRCVQSDAANGGVASVEMGSESASGVMAGYVAYDKPLTRGGTSRVYAWCVKLDAAAFRAKSTTGAANMWARATAVDGSMQQRVIGGPSFQGGYDTEQFAGNYPMTLYPRTAENDTTATVCPSGGATYTTVALALQALKSGSSERPLIRLTCSGAYTITNPSAGERSTGLRAVITNDAGVVAVLSRPGITYNDTSTYYWTPGWNGLEIRGNPAGGGSLTIDQHWWTSIQTSSMGIWFNGITVTNSSGTFNTAYWNGDATPGFGGSGGGRSYWDNSTIEHGVPGTPFSRYAQNGTLNDIGGSVFTSTHFAYGNQGVGYTNDFFYTDPGIGVTIRYTPPAGQTTATIEKTGAANNTAGADVIVKANGSPICTAHAGYYTTDTIPTINALITYLNANCAGVVATLNTSSKGPFRASALGGLNPFTPLNIRNVDADLPVGFDPHAEMYQGYSGGAVRQNVTIMNNSFRGSSRVPWWRNDAGFTYDMFWVGNTLTGTANQGPQVSGGNQSHMQILNNTMTGGFTRDEYLSGSPDLGDQTYSLASNNITDTVYPFGYSGSGPNFPYSFPFKNTIYTATGAWVLNGPNDTNAFNYTTATFASLFTNLAIGDMRPGAFPLANQVAPIRPFDGRVLPYSNPDVAGSWSKNDPYP